MLSVPRLPPACLQHNNSVHGTIPASWALPPHLEALALSSNHLSGTIPSEWPLPNGLVFLELQNNPGLCGRLPATWSLPYLVSADFHGCSFEGERRRGCSNSSLAAVLLMLCSAPCSSLWWGRARWASQLRSECAFARPLRRPAPLLAHAALGESGRTSPARPWVLRGCPTFAALLRLE